MTNQKRFNVADVGLGSGAEFIPLWQKHPRTDFCVICQCHESALKGGAIVKLSKFTL